MMNETIHRAGFIARECRRRLRLVDELAGPSGNMGFGWGKQLYRTALSGKLRN